MRRVFPLSPDGPAAEYTSLIGAHDGLTIADRTAWPRFGVKGPGAADWLKAAGVKLPAANRLASVDGMTVLRLGGNDITILGDPERLGPLADLQARWTTATGPKGYSSWREEAWAWLTLSGPALDETLARHCAVDLRPGRFADDQIAQTRFTHHDAVVIRRGGEANVLFDIASTAAVMRALRPAMRQDETVRRST